MQKQIPEKYLFLHNVGMPGFDDQSLGIFLRFTRNLPSAFRLGSALSRAFARGLPSFESQQYQFSL